MNYTNFIKKIRVQILITAFILLTISCRNSQKIFQQNTENWEISGDAQWKFSNNELIGSVIKGAGFAINKQSYKNFILELEFKPNTTINSGVFIRCKNENMNTTDCYEINIWDLHPNQNFRTGAIVMKSVPIVTVNTNNKWNTYKIKAKKEHIQVWINDILTADINDNSCAGGRIALQASGTGEIRFRNIKIKPLKPN